MKRIILILLTTLTFSSYVHAEDISYYRIDGMKVGDSLLDYLSEKAIIGNFGRDNGILLGFCVGIPCVTFACWKLYIDEWRDEED